MSEVWAALLRPLEGTPGDDRVTEAVQAYRAHYARTGRRMNTVFPGIPGALSALRDAGVRLLVATAKPGDIGALIVRELGLGEWVSATYGSVPGGALDQKADLFAHILRVEGLDPGHTVVAGDWRYDMAGARANGLAGLGAGWGYDTPEALLASGAEAVIPAPGALPAAVAALLRRARPSPQPAPP